MNMQAIALAFLAAGTAAFFLPASVVRAGTIVATGVVGYLGIVHWVAPQFVASNGFKELLVGIGFAAGVAVPLAASTVALLDWLPAAAAFGVLCWLNCRLIDRWESRRSAGAARARTTRRRSCPGRSWPQGSAPSPAKRSVSNGVDARRTFMPAMSSGERGTLPVVTSSRCVMYRSDTM